MQNIEMSVHDNILTIKIDLLQEQGESASGKSVIVATSKGNQPIPNTKCKIGINVYRPLK
jgi:hypothetical protein